MRDVVLIPAFQRPEYLFHTLMNIRQAEGAEKLFYLFRFDHGHAKDLHEAIELAHFDFPHEVTYTPRSSYGGGKQSFSLLSGYQLAAERSTGYVFMIEEDVFVASDFFRWHYAVHSLHPGLFCSIAVRNPNRTVPEGEHDEYYLTTNDYCSLGVCFRKEVINEHVLPHAVPAYYVNAAAYMRRHFPRAPFNPTHIEQDGLIRRIQWSAPNRSIAYPFHPRAYHAGYYGTNRSKPPVGTLQQRIDHLTEVCYSEDAMCTFALNPAYFEDSRPVDLIAQQWTELKLRSL